MTHQTQRRFVCAIFCVFALATAGCSPPRSVVWSPDGTMAALMMEDGIFFADRSGKIITPLLKSVGADALSLCGPTNFRFVAVEPSQPNRIFDLALAKVDDPAAEPKVWTRDWKDDYCVKFLNPQPKHGPVVAQTPALR